MKFLLLAFGLIFLGLLVITGCSSFGARPSDKDRSRFLESKQYNPEKKQFENRQTGLLEEMRKRAFTWKIFKEWFQAGKDRVPKEKLPEVKPDMEKFLASSEDLKIIWFGHSSFLLNMSGKIVLVDPVFSAAASPISFLVKRFQEPVLQLGELPKIDYILISHDHYDHLDMESIQFFNEKDIQFIVPLGVGIHLKKWGVQEERIVEKDWWETAQFDGINFIATPAQHFSGRDGINNNETLWASWVIRSDQHNVYFSGDTGYDIHFKEIGEKYGPFDIAFLESGQYNKSWKEVHMLPEEGAQAYKDLRAKKYFPVHWGMFELAFHTWYDPIERLLNLSKEDEIDLVAPKIGEIVSLSEDHSLESWWSATELEIADRDQMVCGTM